MSVVNPCDTTVTSCGADGTRQHRMLTVINICTDLYLHVDIFYIACK